MATDIQKKLRVDLKINTIRIWDNEVDNMMYTRNFMNLLVFIITFNIWKRWNEEVEWMGKKDNDWWGEVNGENHNIYINYIGKEIWKYKMLMV